MRKPRALALPQLPFPEKLARVLTMPDQCPKFSAEELFTAGLAFEEAGNLQSAIEAYEMAIAADSNFCAAYVNLGTLYYNRHDYAKAEELYRRAIEVDPRYALARFDLGNVLDETGRLDEAIEQYKVALKINPLYADCHYNIALCYERLANPGKAFPHWKRYLAMDPSGPWHAHASLMVEKFKMKSPLAIVWRRSA